MLCSAPQTPEVQSRRVRWAFSGPSPLHCGAVSRPTPEYTVGTREHIHSLAKAWHTSGLVGVIQQRSPPPPLQFRGLGFVLFFLGQTLFHNMERQSHRPLDAKPPKRLCGKLEPQSHPARRRCKELTPMWRCSARTRCHGWDRRVV